MFVNKSMGFRPWLLHAAASRLVAKLQNSISTAIQSHRSEFFAHIFDKEEFWQKN